MLTFVTVWTFLLAPHAAATPPPSPPPVVHVVAVVTPAPAQIPPEVTTTTTTDPPPTTLPSVPPQASTPSPVSSGWGCAAAEAYLAVHQAPGFTDICTDDPQATILGNEAATCIPPNPACTAGPEIAIADPCPAAYMNEASNSWVLEGLSTAPIDPYGAC